MGPRRPLAEAQRREGRKNDSESDGEESLRLSDLLREDGIGTGGNPLGTPTRTSSLGPSGPYTCGRLRMCPPDAYAIERISSQDAEIDRKVVFLNPPKSSSRSGRKREDGGLDFREKVAYKQRRAVRKRAKREGAFLTSL